MRVNRAGLAVPSIGCDTMPWKRLLQINAALWGYLSWWLLVRMGLVRPREAAPARLAHVLEGLGTTFVKLGQGLSLHRELLPDAYVTELARLQDNVAPFDPTAAREEIRTSFGMPVEELFGSYEETPFAAGSIAQVHRATMPDGRPVVVKVRRPGIRRLVEQDVRVLRWFVTSVCWVVPAARAMRPQELVDELARNLRKEIDFRQEALNILRFREMFSASPDMYVPSVVEGRYTDWVIVQEMSSGRRIDLPELRADGPRLAHCLVEAYLRQFFVEGVFHGDPHPGNLFVLPDGRICLHDFGLIGFLDRPTRLNLVAFMFAFADHDADWLLDSFLDLGMIAGEIDRTALRAGLEEIIQDYARKPLRDWSFGEAFLRVTRLAGGRSARVPHHLLVLMRAIFLMESTVRKLDPDFNLLQNLFARAADVLKESGGDQVALSGHRAKFEASLLLQQAPRHIASLAHDLRVAAQSGIWRRPGAQPRAESGASALAPALIALGLYLAGSWLLIAQAGPRVFGLPALPALAYAVAAVLTWRCARGAP